VCSVETGGLCCHKGLTPLRFTALTLKMYDSNPLTSTLSVQVRAMQAVARMPPLCPGSVWSDVLSVGPDADYLSENQAHYFPYYGTTTEMPVVENPN
jgi:hypothetical protein